VETFAVDCGLAIKRLADFLQLGALQSGDGTQLAAGSTKFAVYKLTFASPVVLNGSTPTRLNVLLRDNLTTAVTLKFLAEASLAAKRRPDPMWTRAFQVACACCKADGANVPEVEAVIQLLLPWCARPTKRS
jgi:hypothetical protein